MGTCTPSSALLVFFRALVLVPLCTTSLAAQAAELIPSAVHVTGIVFEDRDGDGERDPGEAGIPGVAVSDQATVVVTDASGRFDFAAGGYGVVSVVQPDGYLVRGSAWRLAEADTELSFALAPIDSPRDFTFVHASDTHLDAQSLPRLRRLRVLVDSLSPAFVLITGDLVRDALRVPDTVALPLYEMLVRELAEFPVPVHTVPGNHENFGIERYRSLVSPSHPLYGKRMYRSFRGPNYYSFTFGGVHFVGFDSEDYDDQWYHGHLDSLQLAWLRQDLDRVDSGTPVVTFNHIPLASASMTLGGYRDDGVAPDLIRIGGRQHYRHLVYNASDVLQILGDRLELALGGHFHRPERLSFLTAWGVKRFHLTAAVVGPATPGTGPLGVVSGITLYHVSDGRLDDGTFIPLGGR